MRGAEGEPVVQGAELGLGEPLLRVQLGHRHGERAVRIRAVQDEDLLELVTAPGSGW